MELDEVLPAFKCGKSIRRQSMPKGFFFARYNNQILIGVTLADGTRSVNLSEPTDFNGKDVFATDWEIME